MNRTSIINYLIAKYHYKSYLEIGVQNGINFHSIYCSKKVGVDPDPSSAATVKMTSDDFFAVNKDKFDLVFLDGLHWDDFFYRDVVNSLEVLNEGGIIICHDCLPECEYNQQRENHGGSWTGDVYKGFVRLRAKDDVVMRTINTDWGCGIITKGKQEPLIVLESDLTYDNFEKNKQEWMNIISVEEFKELY